MFKKITNLFKGKDEKKKEQNELETQNPLQEDIDTLEQEKDKDIKDLKKQTNEDIKDIKKDLEKDKEDENKLDDIKDTIVETNEKIEDADSKLEEVVEKVKDIDEKLEDAAEKVEEKTEEVDEKIDKVSIPAEVYNEEMDFDSHKEEVIEKKEGFFKRLKTGLSKTKKGITEKVDMVLSSYRKIDEELFEDLEEVLIMADIGVETTLKIIESVKEKVKLKKVTEVADIKVLLKEEMKEVLLSGGDTKLNLEPSPAIMLVVGVNGAGKTTTIGKLSARLKSEGKSVLMVAGDTFRAAAIEQLGEWSKRSGVDIISHQEGSDAAAVIFDGIQAAKARKTDVLICDTAGRLHNKKNLMNELNKIFRIVEREYPEARKEVLLVVDATTGQNAILQAKTFKEACDITGIALTKLDGTAKGGVVIGLQSELQVPVKLVGVGEQIDDLQDFNADDFVNAIFDE